MVHSGFLFAWTASLLTIGALGKTLYSDIYIRGGNCPISRNSCVQEAQSYTFYKEGCTSWDLENNGANAHVHNLELFLSESIFGMISAFYGFVVMLHHIRILRFFMGPMDLIKLIKKRGTAIFSLATWEPWFITIPDEDLDHIASQSYMARIYQKRPGRWYILVSQGMALLVAVVVCCVTLPIHIRAQVNPPIVGVYEDGSLGDDSWSDCFELRPPADRLGWFSYWWNAKTGRVLHALAVL